MSYWKNGDGEAWRSGQGDPYEQDDRDPELEMAPDDDEEPME